MGAFHLTSKIWVKLGKTQHRTSIMASISPMYSKEEYRHKIDTSGNTHIYYQLSSQSSLPLVVDDVPFSPCSAPDGAVVSVVADDPGTGPLRMAAVPMTSDRDPLRACPDFSSEARDEKSSQKSLRSGSTRERAAPCRPSSSPSTKRLNWSAAPRAPACRFWPQLAA